MNINQVVCVHLNWFAEIKTGTVIGDHQPMRLPLNISSAHYRKTRQFLKAEKIQRNCYFDRKIQQRILFTCSAWILHVCKTISCSLCSHQNDGELCENSLYVKHRCAEPAHPLRWTKKIHRSLDGERNSEALSQSVCSARQNIYVLNLYVAPKSHTGEYNLGIY